MLNFLLFCVRSELRSRGFIPPSWLIMETGARNLILHIMHKVRTHLLLLNLEINSEIGTRFYSIWTQRSTWNLELGVACFAWDWIPKPEIVSFAENQGYYLKLELRVWGLSFCSKSELGAWCYWFSLNSKVNSETATRYRLLCSGTRSCLFWLNSELRNPILPIVHELRT